MTAAGDGQKVDGQALVAECPVCGGQVALGRYWRFVNHLGGGTWCRGGGRRAADPICATCKREMSHTSHHDPNLYDAHPFAVASPPSPSPWGSDKGEKGDG